MDIKTWLKFLFPEYQIIESVRQYGFWAKGKPKENIPAAGMVSPQGGLSRKVQTSPSAEGASAVGGYANAQSNSNAASYHGKTDVKISGNKLDSNFERAKVSLFNQFVGQKSAVEDLLVAFKRPLVAGSLKDMPKNTIFVIGSESAGKRTLINTAVAALQQENLLNYNNATQVKLSLYPTQSEKGLFFSDLYKALYTSSDVIIFNRFENCHSGMLDVISQLVVDGKYQLGARYAMQNNNLVEATGVLTPNSISEIGSNGKYFIFITNSTENQIADRFGARFMGCVGDIVRFNEYSGEEILEITNKFLHALSVRCRSHLSMTVNFADSFIYYCVDKYKKKTGFKGVEEYIANDIYKALSEYKLRNALSPFVEVSLQLIASRVAARFVQQGVSQEVDLTSFLPKKNTGNLADIKKELAQVVGLAKVKEYVLDLENNLKVQQMREDAGFKAASVSKHMIFTGNPGTGKTTIARIVAKYLKTIGVLSTGQLREVSRADLVGQYVGHTAKQTNEVIRSALGGVLFIDEAYSLCRDKNDVFGLEAIDALVKAIEDYRDDFVVILAGYKDEMADFMKTNSGLKSRFPNIIEFDDYTAAEMVQIAGITAKSKGYRIALDCQEALEKLFEKSQIKGRNDSGNGRLVRNVIEKAILEQSKRIADSPEAEMDLLSYEDFKFDEFEKFDLEKSLGVIIGLEQVKEFVRTQYKLLIANEKRRKVGVVVDTSQTLNMLFTGNPGTGKTTIARVVASMFKDMGLLKQGHLVETDRVGLVAEYVGQTAKKTEEVFRGALGGVLFIDEAYALSSDGSSFGQEAIDTLVKLVEDYRGEIVVILAGYKKEMAEFIKANSGLASRFPLAIDFPDYHPDELLAIAHKMISAKGFHITEAARKVLHEQVQVAHKTATANSGNGRMIRNMVEKILRNQSARIASMDNVTLHGLTEITPDDIEPATQGLEIYDLEKALAGIVGLSEVKNFIRSLYARLRIQKERQNLGLVTDSTQSLHMLFKGNPGTGKTMIARTIADVLHHIGVINTNKLVETDRAGLVAGFVGQTAIKTSEKVMEAIDGVLFIDEAYSLAHGGPNDFGREAIDTLVKLMDDKRERLVVILAGYSKNMDDFLQTNPGLRSRFPNVIEFADYTIDELLLIAENLYPSKGYVLSAGAEERLRAIFETALKEEAFGNGRYVRNVFERSVNKQALRLSTDTDLTREELTIIEQADIEEV